MTESSKDIVHSETLELHVPIQRVREFILTPERILDYYPDPIEGGVLEVGKAIYCRGAMGVSLLEIVDEESTPDCLVLKVTTAIGLNDDNTRASIEAAATFTMIEDWALTPSQTGTTLAKTWRNVQSTGPGPEPFPIADAVRQGAIHESEKLIAAWNQESARQDANEKAGS